MCIRDSSLTESLGAKGIVVITRRGLTAHHITNCRPQTTPIYAFTNEARTRRQLSLNRAVTSSRIEFSSEPEKTLQHAMEVLQEKYGLSAGDKVVVVSDVIAGAGVDAVQIRTLC